MSSRYTVGAIAAQVDGQVVGDANRVLTGVSSLVDAGPGDLVFVESRRNAGALGASRAGAAIVPAGVVAPPGMPAIRVVDPAHAMTRAVDLLVPPDRCVQSISPLAFLGSDLDLGEGVGIGPFAYVGDRVRIGRGTQVFPGVTIGSRTTIGDDCTLHGGVHLYEGTTLGDRVTLHSGVVIGADGFGFVREPRQGSQGAGSNVQRQRKVRHVGRVVIEDDVEIGANSTVDRATLGVTRIGEGTKIDNLVTVGHNCVVGRHCVIVGQAGLSGSTILEDGVTVAGQAGLAGHLRIGHDAVIGAQAGVTKDVPAGQAVLGAPAVEAGRARRALVLVSDLPAFKRAITAHEARLSRLERGSDRDVT